MAGFVAQEHLRRVHREGMGRPLLSSLVDIYKQQDAFERISKAMDNLSVRLSRSGFSEASNQNGASLAGVSKLICLRVSWTHRTRESFLELRIGAQLVVRCKLKAGHLTLGSICMLQRQVPHEWRIAQRNEALLASPNAAGKLEQFVLTLARHELLALAKRSIQVALGEDRTIIQLNSGTGTLHWIDKRSKIDSVDQQQGHTLKVDYAASKGGLQIAINGEERQAKTIDELVQQMIGVSK